MSLYTPVFPSFQESSTSQKAPPDNAAPTVPGKQQGYADFLRDVHLFLSTQSDVLSPPSRPNSPLFDHRVQKVRDKIRIAFTETECDIPSGRWTRVSQTLKLGCVRGRRYTPASGTAPCAPEEDMNWILPDEESQWIEWEKKREENRRLKAKSNVPQQMDVPASAVVDSQNTHFAQRRNGMRERPPRDVSPTTLRAAKEKVRKWQATMAPEIRRDVASSSSSTSTRAFVAATIAKDRTEKPQRSRTIDFAVVKPAAKSVIGKRGKDPQLHPGIRGGSAPIPLQMQKLSTPLNPVNVSEDKAPGSKQPPRGSPVEDVAPKIADMPETPYLPPSFPAHLETSTPLPDSVGIVRAKPSPILPVPGSSFTPLPSISADPSTERQLSISEPHAANTSSCLLPQPPQIDILQPGKRSGAASTSSDGILSYSPVTPPAKRLRTLSENRPSSSPRQSRALSPNVVDMAPCTSDNALDPRPYDMRALEMAAGEPSTPQSKQLIMGTGVQSFPDKIPSPTKSVKSHFSAPDSDPGDSPIKTNLLLESPVSPMFSCAQNPSGFLPQVTSTQAGNGSPGADRINEGLKMGYSSQFDVERHVDRVSELLEKDVDFEGWLLDVRTVEMSQG